MTGTILSTREPPGLEIFFEELAAVPGPPDPGKLAPLFVKYGLELLGPPLAGDCLRAGAREPVTPNPQAGREPRSK